MPARYYFHISVFCVACAVFALPAHAQDNTGTTMGNGQVQTLNPADMPPMPPPGAAGVNVLPAHSLSTEELATYDPDSPTHPALRLTPDKSEIVHLDEGAGTVIVGNPNHISIMVENAKTLVVTPLAPGATYFTVLNSRGAVIMQRHVIVGSPEEKYVRIRKSCAGTKGECQTTQVYYCPDMCHEIMLSKDTAKESNSAIEKEITTDAKAAKDTGGSTAADMGGTDGTDSGSDAGAGQ